VTTSEFWEMTEKNVHFMGKLQSSMVAGLRLAGMRKVCPPTASHKVVCTAARIVTLAKKFDHITPVFIDLHWLPVHFRILFKVLLLVYKALNGMAPLYLTELLSNRTCSRTLRSTDQELLAVPLLLLNSGMSCH